MSEKTIDHSQRAHALLSASSAARWLACPPSAVAAEAYPNQDTAFTREGTLAHEVAEILARGCCATEEEAHFLEEKEDVTTEMIGYGLTYRDYIQEHVQNEDAIILLEQRVDFSPWVPDGFGTCDCIIIQGETLTVIDYKYGKGVAVDAKRNPQMMLYALGALNDYGFAYSIATVEMHIYQPRIDNISTFSMSADELMEWAEKTVKPTATQAADGKGKFAPGSHCRFCPHAGRCKELTKVCTMYVNTHGLKKKLPVLAPHEVAEALQMEPLVSLWLKRIKDQALTDMLNGKEIPGYKVVEGKQGNRKWTDELQVAGALKAAGFSREEVTETKLLSPANMDKAIGKAKVAELLTHLIDRAPGAPTIAPESDKRPVYDQTAETLKDLNS